jgi:polysaccharide export outer membrane protein
MKHLLTCMLALFIGVWLQNASAEDASYILGSGDVLKITVYNNPDLSLEARVTEGGLISFPLVGEIQVGGITPFAAEKKIAALLENGGFVKQPQINILVTQFQSKLVTALGNVYKPGRYPLDRATTLADLLAIVGGITPAGSDMITVTTTRDNKPYRYEVDIDTLLRTGNDATNIELASGDSIYVARAPMFYIYGEVQRPGSFRVERNMTVMQALAQGGGPTARGTQRNIQLQRRNAEGVLVKMQIAPTDPVQQDDVLYVQESLF